MRTIFIISTLILVTALTGVAYGSPFSGPRPIAVIIERNPWLMVIGSDTPSMVLYDDGTFVFANKSDSGVKYKTKRLDSLALKVLMKMLGPNEAFMNLHGYYVVGDAFDLPSVDIYLTNGEKTKSISVYGVAEKEGQLKAITFDGEIGKSIPQEFTLVFNQLRKIPREDTEFWEPKYIEVMIWPYEYSPEKPLAWPSDWPGLKDKYTIKRREDAYSIFLPFSLHEDLKNISKKLKPKQAILLDGKKWAISARYVFPNEQVWREAFKELDPPDWTVIGRR